MEGEINIRNQLFRLPHFMYEDANRGKNIYIMIDMCHAYVNIFKPKIRQTTFQINEFKKFIEQKVWIVRDEVNKIDVEVSPLDVLENPSNKLFKTHYDLIQTVDLDYPPYVLDRGNILIVFDGYHRLARIYSELRDDQTEVTIGIIIFSEKLIKNLSFEYDWNIKEEKNFVSSYMMIEKFFDKFCKTKKKSVSII